MYIKKLALNPKTLSTNYNGCMALGNLRFYGPNGKEIVPTELVSTDSVKDSTATFKLNGISCRVTAKNAGGAADTSYAYGVTRLFAQKWVVSTSYLCGKEMDVYTNYRERGVFFEFEKPINLLSISFNYGTTKVLNHASDWEVWANDTFCVKKDINKKQDDGQDIHTVKFKFLLLEKTADPGKIYYIQGITPGISSIDFRPTTVGGEYGGSFTVNRFELWNEDTKYTCTLQQAISGYSCVYLIEELGTTFTVTSAYNYDTSTYHVKNMFNKTEYPSLYVAYVGGVNKEKYTIHLEFSELVPITNVKWGEWNTYPGRNGKNWEMIIDRNLPTEKNITGINSTSFLYNVNIGD